MSSVPVVDIFEAAEAVPPTVTTSWPLLSSPEKHAT